MVSFSNTIVTFQSQLEVSGVPRKIPVIVTYNDIPILNPNNTAVCKLCTAIYFTPILLTLLWF